MLPLCRLSCSEWVLLHMALIPALFAAAVVCFYLVINGNTELERIVRTLTDINYGHYREQAGREEKRPVGLPASLQLLPDNCNHLTQPGAGPLKA